MLEIDRCTDDFLDATAYACPSWWRGNSRATEVVCQLVNNWLDGDFSKGQFSGQALNDLKSRIQQISSRLTNLAEGYEDNLPVVVPVHDGSVIHLPYVQISNSF